MESQIYDAHLVKDKHLAIISFALACLITSVILVATVAALILLERKLLALSQRRIGPSILGRRGILQIVADVVKPLFKDIFESKLQVVTVSAASVFFLLVSQIIFSNLFQLDVGESSYGDGEFSILIQAVLSVLAGSTTVLIGYTSGSKYGMLGAIRLLVSDASNDIANFVSTVLIYQATSGFDYESMESCQNSAFCVALLSFIYSFAMTFHAFIAAQRSPLDLIEVEGELVAGYNTEYSGADVLVIYFAEYFHLFNAAVQLVMSLFGIYAILL